MFGSGFKPTFIVWYCSLTTATESKVSSETIMVLESLSLSNWLDNLGAFIMTVVEVRLPSPVQLAAVSGYLVVTRKVFMWKLHRAISISVLYSSQ